MIEASGAHNHDRFYSRKRPAEGRFGRLPFLTVRFQERQAWLDRGSLAKIDSIEAGEKIDDFAPDGSSFHADPRLVPINRGRRGELSGRLPDHADRAAGKGFTEHDPRGPLLHSGKESAEDFVGRARDVRSEDQTQTSALILAPFDGLDSQPDSLRDGGIIKIRVEVLILLYKHKESASRGFLDQLPNLGRGNSGCGFQNGAEGRSAGSKTGQGPQACRAIGWSWEGADHFLRYLNRHETGIQILVNVKDDCAGNGVQDVGGSEMSIRLKQHF